MSRVNQELSVPLVLITIICDPLREKGPLRAKIDFSKSRPKLGSVDTSDFN